MSEYYTIIDAPECLARLLCWFPFRQTGEAVNEVVLWARAQRWRWLIRLFGGDVYDGLKAKWEEWGQR